MQYRWKVCRKEGKSAGKRESLQERRNFRSIDEKNAGKRRSLQEKGNFCSIDGKSAGNRGSLQEKGNFCNIDGKSAGQRKVCREKGESKYYVMAIVCRKEGSPIQFNYYVTAHV